MAKKKASKTEQALEKRSTAEIEKATAQIAERINKDLEGKNPLAADIRGQGVYSLFRINRRASSTLAASPIIEIFGQYFVR